jgi:hypothetical protein
VKRHWSLVVNWQRFEKFSLRRVEQTKESLSTQEAGAADGRVEAKERKRKGEAQKSQIAQASAPFRTSALADRAPGICTAYRHWGSSLFFPSCHLGTVFGSHIKKAVSEFTTLGFRRPYISYLWEPTAKIVHWFSECCPRRPVWLLGKLLYQKRELHAVGNWVETQENKGHLPFGTINLDLKLASGAESGWKQFQISRCGS